MASVDEIPIIPRQVLFGNPDKAQVTVSPDGQRISYLAPVNGVLNVWVGPAADWAAAKPVTNDTGRGIRFHAWAYTNRHVLYIQDQKGDENWHVYRVDLDTGEVLDLTPVQGVQARLHRASPGFPDEILVEFNDRDPALHDLYRVHIGTGRRILIQQNTGFSRFVTDENYTVRFAARMTPDGGREVLQAARDGGWELFDKVSLEDELTTHLIGFDRTGTLLYSTESRERDTAALMAMDLRNGRKARLAEDPRSDVGNVMMHPLRKTVEAVSFTYERKRWEVLDPSVEADLAYLATVADGEVEVASRSLDDRSWIVAYLLDNGPVRFYLYDRNAKKAQFLFTNRKDLEGLPLARMHPVTVPSRDGLNLVCYYSLPAGSDSRKRGRPDHPLPLVLFVHGGPWGRDHWGFHPWHQWLANRGYAVLGVNFRGSTGFGKAFVNAGNHEWGGKMHTDLLDAADWAVRERIASPGKVAIMGGSYGGYAALVGLTFTPEAFACGVDTVGPSNLVTLLESAPPYWKPVIDTFTARIGDHRTEEGRAFLTSRSPLTRADRIRRPLLIGQGANDPRVTQAESDQIVQAMQAKGIPVTYVLYPDEGHGFARPENNLSFNAITEAFLAGCLGGRCEPVGDDFKGSSLTVPVGAGEIAGLPEALKRA